MRLLKANASHISNDYQFNEQVLLKKNHLGLSDNRLILDPKFTLMEQQQFVCVHISVTEITIDESGLISNDKTTKTRNNALVVLGK